MTHDRPLICLSPGVNGSTGDIRPLIALSLALRARGFDILLLGDAAFERAALRAGLSASEWFTCSEIPQTMWLRTEAGQRSLWGQRLRSRDRWMPRELRAHWADRLERFWRLVGGPDNPRIVAAVGAITASRLLRRFGPHCARIISCPMPYQPSREVTLDPPDLSMSERLRAWRRARRPATEDDRIFREEMFHLVSVSPTIFPRPSDWLPNMQVTGYVPFDDDQRGWSPPEALSAFLKAGPPPIYVGFGAHAVLHGPDGERRAREIIQGCERRACRCIIHSADLRPSVGSDRVCVLDGHVPHAWLFPRCAAIVHHGGYGTLHEALVARRPMIIYPFQTDQFLWARRIGELGAGPGFTGRLRDLSATRLASDLDVVRQPASQAHAEQLGDALAHDRGLARQVVAIESIIEHTRRGLAPMAWQMPIAADAIDEVQRAREQLSAVHT